MMVHIKENSWLAGMAAKKLRSQRLAIVFGRTIYLFNATKDEFLANEKWVKHELAHVQQYHQYGFVRFVFLYIVESIRKGYHHNRFEAEARSKENDPLIKSLFNIT